MQSALSQIAEALAADMIDLKHAHALMAVLRFMSLNFRHHEEWQAILDHSDQPDEVDLAREYSLPHDHDLDPPPAAAYPPPENLVLSEEVAAAADELKDPFAWAHQVETASFSSVGG